jgi:hypothetical protein
LNPHLKFILSVRSGLSFDKRSSKVFRNAVIQKIGDKSGSVDAAESVVDSRDRVYETPFQPKTFGINFMLKFGQISTQKHVYKLI